MPPFNPQKILEKNKEKILENSGHILLEIYKERKCLYQCGNCGSRNQTRIGNLLKKTVTKYCSKCQNDKNKKNFDDIIKDIENQGMVCVTKPEEYINNKQKLKCICICGNNYEAKLADINKGKKCMTCAPIKRKDFYQKNYGVDNAFQLEEVKEKSKQTSIKKYGVEYHLQNKENLKKLEDKTLEKTGKKWAFTQNFVYEKIKKTHLKNYGVEYPLQSKEIQNKIDLTFIKIYGERRPMMNKDFKENLKKINLKKYGTEYFVTSQAFKNVMKEKYNAENPMHCPEIFHRAVKSMFSKKEYTFLSGKKIAIMGYEDIAINYLLSTKNTYLNKVLYEDDIIVGIEVPSIKYKDDDNKLHIYYPDIFIKDSNLLIEVKSIYTFNLDPRKNFLKFRACANEGYALNILFFDSTKNLFDTWYFRPGKNPKSNRGLKIFDKPYECYSNLSKDTVNEDEIDIGIKDIFLDDMEECFNILFDENITEEDLQIKKEVITQEQQLMEEKITTLAENIGTMEIKKKRERKGIKIIQQEPSKPPIEYSSIKEASLKTGFSIYLINRFLTKPMPNDKYTWKKVNIKN